MRVTDANEAPVLDRSSYSFSVSEDAANGDIVGTVTATDEDTGDTLTYSITGGNTGAKFSIDSSTGEVTVAGTLDYATTSSYTLTLQVSDGNGGTDTAKVAITVTDVNEAPVLDPSSYTFSVSEDAASGDIVGTVTATDEDTGDTLTYSITGGNTGRQVLHRLLHGRGHSSRDTGLCDHIVLHPDRRSRRRERKHGTQRR